mgnify:FL=1
MEWFFIYVVSLLGLWHVMDQKADTLFASVIAPMLFVFVLIAFFVRLSIKMGGSAPSSSSGSSGPIGGFWGGGGDSCGGGGDGGGC